MSALITTGASSIVPTWVTTYESSREAQTIVHTVLGRSDPDVTLRPALLRSGRVELGFHGSTDEADSKAAADVLSLAAVFALSSSDRPTLDMSFVVTGRIPRALERTTQNAWAVSFEFQEVTT